MKNNKKENKPLDLNELKKGGLLKQRQKDYFILRTRLPAGYLKTSLLPKIKVLADKYGKGYVHLSTRQCIEIAWIHVKNLDNLMKDLKKYGILKGACGPRSRNVVSCPGSSVCRFGFTNTEKLAFKLDKKFFGRDVPKKFKIALTGCLNSCAKPQENDLGFVAQAEPELDLTSCIKCGLCASVCKNVCARGGKEPAIIMDENKIPVYRKQLCLYEGDCIRCCPVNAWKAGKTGYAVFVGGKIGRFPMLGFKIAEFATEEEVFTITAKTIEAYNKIAAKGQRLGEAINKTGIEEFKKMILP